MIPNERLVASVPAIDWNTRSTGAPSSIARSVVVTWARTHDWVGISYCPISTSSMSSRRRLCCGESSAGLMPITASPQPRSSPSMIDAMIPCRSSVGWFGWSRTASRPGSPIVDRKAVTFEHFEATSTRSWFAMILLTAATISGVSPHATAARSVGRRVVRQQPVAQLADGHRADRRERVVAVLVVDQPRDIVDLPRDQRLLEERRQLHVGEAVLGGDAFLLRRRGDAGELVARAARRGPRHHRAQVVEAIRPAGQGDAVRSRHAGRPPRAGTAVSPRRRRFRRRRRVVRRLRRVPRRGPRGQR